MLDSTLPLAPVQAASKNLKLRDATLGTALPLVEADEVRFREVLLNLLSNAVKFTAQGLVTVRAGVDHARGFLRLEVEDTGVGIPAGQREIVFEKFVQATDVKGRRYEGTGLGLAISRKLVKMMGGQISLGTGADGRGTLVWFTLPLAGSDSLRKASALKGTSRIRAGQ